MMMAAALLKPTITGCDNKFTMTPSLKIPRLIWIKPTSRASSTAKASKCSEPEAARGAKAVPVIKEEMAAGPIESCDEEPHIAPSITGRNAAYKP